MGGIHFDQISYDDNRFIMSVNSMFSVDFVQYMIEGTRVDVEFSTVVNGYKNYTMVHRCIRAFCRSLFAFVRRDCCLFFPEKDH